MENKNLLVPVLPFVHMNSERGMVDAQGGLLKAFECF